jgi:hypothetical protein
VKLNLRLPPLQFGSTSENQQLDKESDPTKLDHLPLGKLGALFSPNHFGFLELDKVTNAFKWFLRA